MKLLGTDLTREVVRDMFDYMPKEYEDYKESRELIQSQAQEFETLNARIEDVLRQFFIDTATWGLVEWERIIGVKNSESYLWSTFKTMERDQATYADVEGSTWANFELMFPKDMEERRSDIKAKLRGQGTITKQHMHDVIMSYANGEVEILERPYDYTISIRFVSEDAIPYNLDRVKEVIREITPAHLALEYTLAYLLIRDIEQVKTLNEMEQITLNQFAGGATNIG